MGTLVTVPVQNMTVRHVGTTVTRPAVPLPLPAISSVATVPLSEITTAGYEFPRTAYRPEPMVALTPCATPVPTAASCTGHLGLVTTVAATAPAPRTITAPGGSAAAAYATVSAAHAEFSAAPSSVFATGASAMHNVRRLENQEQASSKAMSTLLASRYDASHGHGTVAPSEPVAR